MVSGAGTVHPPRLLQPWRSGLRMGQAGGPWTRVCSGPPAPAQQATHSHPSLQVLVREGAWRPRGLRLPGPHHPSAAGRRGRSGLGPGATARTHPSEILGRDVAWRGPLRALCTHASCFLALPFPALSRLPTPDAPLARYDAKTARRGGSWWQEKGVQASVQPRPTSPSSPRRPPPGPSSPALAHHPQPGAVGPEGSVMSNCSWSSSPPFAKCIHI